MPCGELKNRVRFSTTLPKEAIEGLKELSSKTMIPVSRLVETAVMNLIKTGINGH